MNSGGSVLHGGEGMAEFMRQEYMTGPSQQDGAGSELQGKSQNRYELQRPHP